MVPLLDLKSQFTAIEGEIRSAIDRVLDSQVFIMGPEVTALEQEIANYSQCQFGIGVSSGTDALLVALMALDIGSGDEVITTPYSFFATAGCIARLGAKPVFVDIDPYTFNINTELIESAITEKTRAIIPVHLFGQMAEMKPIMELAGKHNLYVVEDAAQAIGAEYYGERAGTIGHIGCFSFFPSKNLGAFGDGGMVTTNDPDLADRMDILRKHGSKPKYHHKLVGGNFRLDALQAAILRVKLRYLDQWTKARQQNAQIYRQELSALNVTAASVHHDLDKQLVLPLEMPQVRHIYNQFVVRTSRRDALMNHLKSKQIGCEVYYPVPLHLQECFSNLGYRNGDMPVSELAAMQTLAVPIYPELTKEQITTVVQVVQSFLSG